MPKNEIINETNRLWWRRASKHFRLLEVIGLLIIFISAAVEYNSLRGLEKARMHYSFFIAPLNLEYSRIKNQYMESNIERPSTLISHNARIRVERRLDSESDLRGTYRSGLETMNLLDQQAELLVALATYRDYSNTLSGLHADRIGLALQTKDYLRNGVLEELNQISLALEKTAPNPPPVKTEFLKRSGEQTDGFQNSMRKESRWALKDYELEASRRRILFYVLLSIGTMMVLVSKTINWAREVETI